MKDLPIRIGLQEERLSILKVLCRDVRLDSDVDLKYFAEKTCGYSGADLKGLVTTSQFHAIRSANLISKGDAANYCRRLSVLAAFLNLFASFTVSSTFSI